MENIQSIEQYIATEMGGKIDKKRNSPVPALLVLAIGIGLLVVMKMASLGDALSATLLTVGLIATVVGIILTAMNLSGAMSHYQSVDTGRRFKDIKVYLCADDYRKALDALGGADKGVLERLKPVVSSNSALRIMRCVDGSMALVQPLCDTAGHLEPDGPTCCIVGAEVKYIDSLCI